MKKQDVKNIELSINGHTVNISISVTKDEPVIKIQNNIEITEAILQFYSLNNVFLFEDIIKQLRLSGIRTSNKNIKRILNKQSITKHTFRKNKGNGVIERGTYWSSKPIDTEINNYNYLFNIKPMSLL